jgi:hypothetical protein
MSTKEAETNGGGVSHGPVVSFLSGKLNVSTGRSTFSVSDTAPTPPTELRMSNDVQTSGNSAREVLG